MRFMQIVFGTVCLSAMIAGAAAAGDEEKNAPPAPKLKTRNILLATTDGLRWQEVFGGADASLFNNEHGGVANPARVTRLTFGGDKPEGASAASDAVLLEFPDCRNRGSFSAT